ncbi:PorB3 [Desulforapulum autotrophicum HRM2]|uniref:PorB3 n=1 Tax=Desulforapulum autotrophicum (strain ATCC 43914 / DSM 3382 / VKM B-1955 / HRM2) TaxID=177437 RepID=C0QCF0_DESAH|nr:2-oxoacid:ferredoxin oxidoreductase subunit beta [Desulforapulum autotrophicum]ACN17167.1 PorB3 [Desulforapulum autotrophicum HRM2]
MATSKLFDNDFENKWCPGCGNFPILSAMKKAFTDLGLTPADLLLVSGIGQAGKTPHFLNCNMFHSLHGRALPVATGAKIANKDLNIVVNSGDGDCYGEGGNHFVAAIRRNIDITLIVHNNMIYGLTKGQASPTTAMGMATPIQPAGTMSSPVNPLALAISQGAGFVARGFSGEIETLTRLIVQAMEYRGFSLIDVLQPCVSFNRVNTLQWYKDRVYDLGETGHDMTDKQSALERSNEWEEKIPLGILYREEKPTFHDRVKRLAEGPLIAHKFDAKAVAAALF